MVLFFVLLRGRLVLMDPGLLRRGQYHRHRAAFQGGLPIDGAPIPDLLGEPIEQITPDVGVADLASAELDRDLDSVTVLAGSGWRA